MSAEFSECEQHAALYLRSSPVNDTKSTDPVNSENDLADSGRGNQKNDGDKNRHTKEQKSGTSRRLYVELHSARMRRAAIAAEQRRRPSVHEISTLGRLGRTWGLYPSAPSLPRGSYYTPGPTFPEYNWGAGIGPVGDPSFEGEDAACPRGSLWGGGGGWARRLSGHPFGNGGGSSFPSGFGGHRVGGGSGRDGGGRTVPECGEVPGLGFPPHLYGQSRRGRGRFF